MGVDDHRPRRRGRPWWRSRRLIAAIIMIDLVGACSLAYALGRRSDDSSPTSTSTTVAAAPAAAHVTTTTTTASPAPTIAHTAVRRHRRRRKPAMAPATVMTSPSQSRAPGDGGRGTAVRSASLEANFTRMAASLPGQVGLAVAPLGDGPITTFGSFQVNHAWSTSKLIVITTVLAQLERLHQTLDAAGRVDTTLAITQSDNDAADALFSRLEQTHGGLVGASLTLQHTLRTAGDELTVINTAPNDQGLTTWGQTEWSATGEVTFYRALANNCLLSAPDTRYVLGLMTQVIPSQRWGGGSASFPSADTLMFKGGWGPEPGSGYYARQSVIVTDGSRGLVFNMLAHPSDGEFSTATEMLSRIATWVRQSIPLASAPAFSCP